jgi:type II secretory pathway component GspD/PulD (secretin)
MIKELDIPGRQVMLKAIIIEVDHRDLTSLGMQLSSDPENAFGNLDENSITALTQLKLLETSGSLTLNVGTDITVLVDLLVKKIDAKILNQQTLWTKDNEEAMFFKGDKVAFQTVLSMSEVGGRATSSFEFQRVGMTLRARPSITPEKRVDMIVNVILSQLTGSYENSQPVRTEMETTTNMIVQDGQTIMLGGILFQKESSIKRKVPLFGDVPVAGGLFRHKEMVAANNEMIIFITPYVIDEPGKMLPETIEEIERPREKLKQVQEQLKATLERLQNAK